jgi:bile acid:Na+ symporter, BASS family
LSSPDKLVNPLVLILLIEMMVATGLGVSFGDLAGVVKNAGLLARAALANYVLVPAAAILLLYLFHTAPMVTAGFLLVAVCPAAPFAPPLTAMARGNVNVAVGLMVVLAASSAILAPILLSFLLPLMARGANLKIDTFKIVTTLLMTQILPLGIGMLVHSRLQKHAAKLRQRANLLSAVLSLVVFALIISLQYKTLAEIRWVGFVGLTLLILLCLAAGWLVGGQVIGIRRAVGLTTAARNVGVALVIATASFPDSAAVTAVIVVAIFQTVLLTLISLSMGRFSSVPQPF